jgi:hypothetical protein
MPVSWRTAATRCGVLPSVFLAPRTVLPSTAKPDKMGSLPAPARSSWVSASSQAPRASSRASPSTLSRARPNVVATGRRHGPCIGTGGAPSGTSSSGSAPSAQRVMLASDRPRTTPRPQPPRASPPGCDGGPPFCVDRVPQPTLLSASAVRAVHSHLAMRERIGPARKRRGEVASGWRAGPNLPPLHRTHGRL